MNSEIKKLLQEEKDEREHFRACLSDIRQKPVMSKETREGLEEVKDMIRGTQNVNEETHKYLDKNSEARHQETKDKLAKFLFWFIGSVISIGGMVIGGNYLVIKDLMESNKDSFMLILNNHDSRLNKLEAYFTKPLQ